MKKIFTMMIALVMGLFVLQSKASSFGPHALKSEHELIHYWHFNALPSGTLTTVESDFSTNGLSASITYPGTGDGYMDTRTHRAADPVSNMNLRKGQEQDKGAVLRVRNPANTRELLIAAPSTGFENLVVTFAATRSDNGGQQLRFEYTADAGTTWVTVGDDHDIPFIGEGDDVGQYVLISKDLSDIAAVNDNPGLHFRILSVGEGNDNPSGNQRFDNLSIEGIAATTVGLFTPQVNLPGLIVAPNPAKGPVSIITPEAGTIIRVYNMNGTLIYEDKAKGENMVIDTTNFKSGVYIIRGIIPSSPQPLSGKLIVR